MKRFSVKKYADGGDVSEENPERVARNAAEMAKARAAILAKKAEQKRILAEARPQIQAAKAAREAAAERNAAMAGGLSNADITSAVSKAMYAQGASEADRQAALRNITSAMQTGPRDVRGNTDIGSIMKAVGQYATPDQLNAALKASGRQGTFNAFDTYNTGVSGATQSLNDLIAARDASAGIGIKKPVMAPPMEIVYPIKTDQRFEPSPSTPPPPPPPSFDRNAALQAFNARAGEANKMFTSGLFGTGGVSPDEFRSYQTKLRDLQLNTGSTQEQHDAALKEAMSYMDRVAPLPVKRPPEREVIVSNAPPSGVRIGNTPPSGVRSGDTRIFVDPEPQPVTRQPFDPNAALQAFNKRAAELNASGKGLFASGMVPDEFRMYQGVLRNLQLNPNSTPEQHADILNKSMAFLNQYSGATPQPMVDPNVPYRPTGPDAFYGDQTGSSMTYTAPAPITMPPPQPRMIAAPGGSTGFDERTGTYTRPRGPFSSLFNLRFPTSAFARTGGIGGMPPQGSPNALTIARGPVPLDQQGPPLGGGIGGVLGGARMTPSETPQGPVTPMPYNPVNTTRLEDLRGRPGSGMSFRGLSGMFGPRPGQGSFVDTMPRAIEDPNFRFGQTPQQMAPNAQGMALGGLMAKYRGGMC